MPWDDLLERLSDERLEAAQRVGELGDRLNFGEAIHEARRVVKIGRALSRVDPDLLPAVADQAVRAVMDRTIANVEAMEAWDPISNPQERDHILARIKQDLEEIRTQGVPFLSGANVATAEVAAAAEADYRRIEELAAQANATMERLREGAATTGVARMSRHYEAQANHHEAQATRFLKAASALVVVTLALGVALLAIPIETPNPDTAWIDFVRGLTPRVFLIGLGLYLGRFALQQYRVNKHQKVVNEQRRNALDTFALLLSSIEGASSRDLVIVEMVRAVFRGVETGYVSEAATRTVTEEPLAALAAIMGRNQP